jgi:filamentous hemagglutinin family protein
MSYFPGRHVLIMGLMLPLALSARSARAQIVTDGSVGPALALTGPNFQISERLGQTRGQNLFHSFQDFNLARGEAATFSGSPSIANILARVTGGRFSSIDGALNSSIAGANLYFINPNGILFGPNAQINVGGSFVSTTADFVRLQGGGVFNASNPSATTLTSAPVSAFGFLGPQAAPIVVNGSLLGVSAGKSLSLIGGNMSLGNTLLFAEKGQVNLVSVASPGEVVLDGTDSKSTPNLQGFGALGDVSIANAAINVADSVRSSGGVGGGVSVSGRDVTLAQSVIFASNSGSTSGGSLAFEASRNLKVTDGTEISSGTLGSGAGANIDLRARDLSLENDARAYSITAGSGQGGDVSLTAETARLIGGGRIDSSSLGDGQGGSVSLRADSARLEGSGRFNSGIFGLNSGAGAGADVTADVRDLQIAEGAAIFTDTGGSGAGGNIALRGDSVTLDGGRNSVPTGVITGSSGAGRGGSITINATNGLAVARFGQIGSAAGGDGAGGNIEVRTRALSLEKDGSLYTETTDLGPGGNIAIVADQVQVLDRSSLESRTFGPGKGGDLSLSARDVLLDAGQNIGNRTTGVIATSNGIGDGGNIRADIDTLRLVNGAFLLVSTLGSGSGGSIDLQSTDITLDGGRGALGTGILAQGRTGNSGAVKIRTGTLNVLRGGQILTETVGAGNAGDLLINAAKIRLDGQNSGANTVISSTTNAANGGGGAGDITITAKELEVRSDAQIDASTFGDGQGGNINVQADTIRLDDGDGIIATGIVAFSAATVGGRGGNIAIEAKELSVSGGTQISTASLGSGDGGDISIKADNLTVSKAAAGLGSRASEISADTLAQSGAGAGGNIDLVAKTLRVLDGGVVSTSTRGNGRGGQISAQADSIVLDGQGNRNFTGFRAQTIASGNAGNVTFDAKTVQIVDGGRVLATTAGSGAGGEINIRADSVALDGRSNVAFTGIDAQTRAQNGGGIGGGIQVDAKTLRVVDGALISGDTSGSGIGGRINIFVSDILLDGKGSNQKTGILAETSATIAGDPTGKTNQGGDIGVFGQNLRIEGGAEISATTSGNGIGGNVLVAVDNITLRGAGSVIDVGSAAGATGEGGKVELRTKNLQVLDRASISTGTLGKGKGGEILISADRVLLDGQGSTSFTGIGAQTQDPLNGGQGGGIFVTARDVQILNGAAISANTLGTGVGGNIEVKSDRITLDRRGASPLTGISAQTQLATGGGAAGRIDIFAQTLDVVGGAEITSNTRGSGDGGGIFIRADQVVLRDQGKITAQSQPDPATARANNGGSGGDIRVEARTLQISGDARIATNSEQGGGTGGSVSIAVAEQVRIRDRGEISAAAASADGGGIGIASGDSIDVENGQITTSAGANGGNIDLRAARLVRLRRSALRAVATGNGGNISIDQNIVIFDQSQVQADAINGAGGNINIRANVFIPSSDSRISASSQFGVAGNILISAPNPNIGASLAVLATSPLSAEDALEESCLLRSGRSSSFIVGRQGLAAPSPLGLTPSLSTK